MKKCLFLGLILLLTVTNYTNGEDFLGAPLIPEGIIIDKTDDRLEFKVGLSHNDAVKFYKEALKGWEDIKFREWRDSTYIEDDGNRPWHSITILKHEGKETRILVAKDKWTWIIGTLIIRYIGVFVVLMVLFLGIYITGKIILNVVKKFETK
ncbi:MAG: hypothetical protein ABIJ37_09665 [Pseudomonadota bacterium]